MATVAATAPVPAPAKAAIEVGDFQRAMIMIGALLATLTQVLDTTIANVALPHMQTSLNATAETVTWVLTSYIVASAIAIPITGWLADRIGRKRLYVGTVVVFTGASLLCAIATSLPEMVAFRILQGVAGAFILPIGQAVLLDVNPPDKTGNAMTLFGMGVVIGPIIGPFLGGYLTDSFNWRWVFIVNVPVGALCTFLLITYLPATETRQRRFDVTGFALLALALGALQLMLDRGEQRDWFSSWEIWIELGLTISAGWMFLIHMLSAKDPLIDPKMIADRNFLGAMIVTAVAGVVTLAGAALLPTMMQRLLGYSVMQAGMLSAPRGIGVLIAMIVVGRLNDRIDPRLSIFAGIAVVAYSFWLMTGFSLEMDSRPIIVAGLLQGVGLGLSFVPINIMAFATLAPHLRTSAASVLALVRNIGGAVGISMVISMLARNVQVSHSDIAAQVTAGSIPPLPTSFLGIAGDALSAGAAMLDAEINRQAAMIAYINDFHLIMWLTILSLPVAFILRKPARKRAGDTPIVME